MRLLQLNVWMGRLTRQILPLIEREHPDIITTQEIFGTSGVVPLPDQTFGLAQEIVATAHFPYQYFSPTMNFMVGDQTVEFGNAIFSKYPFLAHETIPVYGTPTTAMTAQNYEPNTRNAQLVTVDVDGVAVLVVNHHAFWDTNPLGNQTSTECLQIVADKLATFHDLPIVLAGDLNLVSEAPAMRVFDGMLEDLTATHHVATTLSQLGKVTGVACDHILINDMPRVKDFRVLDDLVSDHKALFLDAEIA